MLDSSEEEELSEEEEQKRSDGEDKGAAVEKPRRLRKVDLVSLMRITARTLGKSSVARSQLLRQRQTLCANRLPPSSSRRVSVFTALLFAENWKKNQRDAKEAIATSTHRSARGRLTGTSPFHAVCRYGEQQARSEFPFLFTTTSRREALRCCAAQRGVWETRCLAARS